MRRGRWLFFSLITASILFGNSAQESERWIGVWKLSVATSKYRGNPERSRTLQLIPAAGGIKYVLDRVAANGSEEHTEYTLTYDGKDVIVSLGRGRNPGTPVAFKRIDSNTFERHGKSPNGAVVSITRFIVSPDGTTLTETSVNYGPDGAATPGPNTLVYDRQP
jgi:hypothetical protein